jgi:hypothetical protein
MCFMVFYVFSIVLNATLQNATESLFYACVSCI